ncbi:MULTISPECIES: phosphopantetheine-binding protein [unclassified Streptomyces]|uniref:phosphopantetheine-binding protein n=1 Tax=unclassified Streptomyces TaxID=2593676 RepID=UPI0036F92008
MSTPEHTGAASPDALPPDERVPDERAPDVPPPAVLPSPALPSDGAEALVAQVAALVSRSTDGLIGVRELLGSTEPLAALGVSSLSLLRLVDAVEETYGVFVDLGDRTLHTEGLRGLTERLIRLGAEATP